MENSSDVSRIRHDCCLRREEEMREKRTQEECKSTSSLHLGSCNLEEEGGGKNVEINALSVTGQLMRIIRETRKDR